MKKNRDADVESLHDQKWGGEDRKLAKKQRKEATARDRSKFKKTDQEQRQQRDKQDAAPTGERGRVLSVRSQGVLVSIGHDTLLCQLRGVLKKEKERVKNLVVVGDWVFVERSSPNEGSIEAIEPRKTILSRADNLSRRKAQLIAANVDQVMIVVSVLAPRLKPALVDRYVIAALQGGLTPIIILNKMDLLATNDADPIVVEVEKELVGEMVKAHELSGIELITVSALTGQGIDRLRQLMKDKTSVFSGQSGVGKSCLINAVTGLNLKTGSVVDRTGKGAHTTTSAQLIPLEFGGWCVDTPGVQSFGVWDLDPKQVDQYFAEIARCGRTCKYSGCRHLTEPDCAVKIAVEEGSLSELRYESYCSLMESAEKEHKRR